MSSELSQKYSVPLKKVPKLLDLSPLTVEPLFSTPPMEMEITKHEPHSTSHVHLRKLKAFLSQF